MLKQRPISFIVNDMGCFEVMSHRRSDGYPVITFKERRQRAHRHIWEECYGPIPDCMCICHHCDNRACINPEHLFLGTNADNHHDMQEKGRIARGERNGQAKLTVPEIKEIRSRYRAGDRKDGSRALARDFSVSQRTIKFIITGKTWGWVGR